MRSVVITGASTGIGRASALHLDAAGWRVFAGVRREQDGESLREAGSERLFPLRLDITSSEQVEAMAERVSAEVGSDGLQGLVNNAGITIPCPLEALPLDDFRRLLAVNLTGHLAATQALLPQLRAAKGRIVFISSISARRALPMLGAYTASKAGLNAVADGFRQELRRWQVGVSIVEPGSIETPIWDRGEREFDGVKERSSVDVEDLYGKLIAAFHDLADRAVDQRLPVEKVVAAIEHALTARRPRPRYVVGREAKMQALAVRFVPDRALDFGVARYLGA
ncbi:MAG TPA: SDR family NAD(P)-dependent oxidoreductase [Solirubrobacterales bacterium]|nr:SDR family NAD(P)-dependent oxidoreductase [Solirubrobacterales bacterium]